MSFDVFVDLDEYDKKILTMTKKEKDEWCDQLSLLSNKADDLYRDKKISKITQNRVLDLWSFSPYQNVNLMPSKEFNKKFGIKDKNLKYIFNAINKINRIEKQNGKL